MRRINRLSCPLKTGNAEHVGIYGFGSVAHIIVQLAYFLNRKIYAFTTPGDIAAQRFASELGVVWA